MTAVRVPYVIGVRIQNLFKEAQKRRFEVATLDFSQTFNNIVQNRIFRVSPPPYASTRNTDSRTNTINKTVDKIHI